MKRIGIHRKRDYTDERWLDDLSADLRTGAIEDALLSFRAEARKHNTQVDISSLRCYLAKHRPGLARALASSLRRFVDRFVGSLPWREHPNAEILELLRELRLEEQFFAYSSRLIKSCPEAIALTCELFQVNIAELPARFPHPLPRYVLRIGDELNFFRLAQKTRNEHGTIRGTSPPDGFRSYEDIVLIERRIRDDDVVNFMIQCIALRAVDDRHMRCMYDSTTTHSQLETFHDAVIRIGVKGLDSSRAASLYSGEFGVLPTSYGNLMPTWRQIERYLRESWFLDWQMINRIFGSNILREELDEALHCALNRIAETPPLLHSVDEPNAAIEILLRLLGRGASLFFRGDDEGRHSLLTLVSLLGDGESDLLLSRFSPYLCCPLKFEGTEVGFDAKRLAPLSCLAARSTRASRNALTLPSKIRSFIDAHRELRIFLDAGAS